LFSFLDDLAGNAGVKDHISYMKPSTTVQQNSDLKVSNVEMKLQGINLDHLTSYLHMIETSPNMVLIKSLSISKQGKQEGMINAILRLETIET